MVDPELSSLSAIFKAYDVRGTVPDQLDEALIERIGAAFAAFVAKDPSTHGTVLIGRDMRPSGVGLSAAFARGVTSQGLDVVDRGLGSTDLVYFGRHADRVAQPRPVQRHQDVPGRRPTPR